MTFTPNVVGLVTIEIAGPEQFGLDELIRKGLSFRGDPREVVADPEARYYGALLEEGILLPGQHGASGSGGRWLCLVDDRQRAWRGEGPSGTP